MQTREVLCETFFPPPNVRLTRIYIHERSLTQAGWQIRTQDNNWADIVRSKLDVLNSRVWDKGMLDELFGADEDEYELSEFPGISVAGEPAPKIRLWSGGYDLAGGQGGQVWPASESLCRMFEGAGGLITNLESQTIVELGTGTGRLGIALALAGARVIATDQASVTESGGLLRRNVLENGLSDNGETGQFQIRELDWCQPDIDDSWPRPDIVVGSDCFFYDYLAEPFVRTLCLLATSSSTLVLLANNGRWNEAFFEILGEYFCYEFLDVSGESDFAPLHVPELPDRQAFWKRIPQMLSVVRCSRRPDGASEKR